MKLLHESFRCLYIDPLEDLPDVIDVSIEHIILGSADESPIDFLPSVMMVEMLVKALHFGQPDISHFLDGADLPRGLTESIRPTFLIHNDLLIQSQTGIPDAPPERWMNFEACPSHRITIRGRTLICGMDRDRYHQRPTYRSAHRSLAESEVHWLLDPRIGKLSRGEGNIDLVPMADGGSIIPHILAESNDSPSPDLGELLKKGPQS
jgi:hypothetical protein